MVDEGGPGSKLHSLIRRIGANPFDRFEFATVISVSPLLIRIDGMKIDLDADDFVIAERLTDYTVTLRRTDGSSEEVTIKSGLRVDDRVIVVQASEGQRYFVIDRI